MSGLIGKKDHSIGWLVFDHPERLNALTYEMWTGIPEIIADFAADPEVRVIILRGAGDKAFISGADISQFDQNRGTHEAVVAYDEAVEGANLAVQSVVKPTIAMIKGFCLGGGLGLAAACDLRIAATDARFAVPAARLGIGYQYAGTKRLVDLVGPSFAKEIFYTARQFDAGEAAGMGFVNRIVAADELETYVRDTAERIAGNAPLTLRAAKLAIDTAVSDPADKDINQAQKAIEACFASQDYKEGRRAFLEKRAPEFVGG
jgi:enoyl-CoA hydratase/carnithine racemase